MTDHQASPNSPGATTPGPQAKPRRLRRYLAVAAIAVAAGLTGAYTTQALSQGGFGGHWGGHGMMGGPMGRAFDPARAEERADRMVRHLAVEIDATAEQQDKLRTIVKAAVKDLIPLREKVRTARERGRQLLTQPTIDRAAIETFRAEQIAQADAASKRMLQALTDAAEVLTPEQRQKISEHMAQRRGHWRGGRRG